MTEPVPAPAVPPRPRAPLWKRLITGALAGGIACTLLLTIIGWLIHADEGKTAEVGLLGGAIAGGIGGLIGSGARGSLAAFAVGGLITGIYAGIDQNSAFHGVQGALAGMVFGSIGGAIGGFCASKTH